MAVENKRRVLIVEDDKDISATMAKGLETLGYTVMAITESGEDAIVIADETSPDFVIMDVNLAGEFNGIETGGRIERLFKIPTIYISGYMDKVLSLQENGKIPLMKPFSMDDLKNAIHVLFTRLSM